MYNVTHSGDIYLTNDELLEPLMLCFKSLHECGDGAYVAEIVISDLCGGR